MNIVYVHQHFSTTRGHTGTRSYDFARLLVARGHRVTVVAGVYGAGDAWDIPPRERVARRTLDGIDLRIINVRYNNKQTVAAQILAFLRFMVLSTLEVLRVRDADVVFATSTPLTVGFCGTAARYLRGRPFVFEIRDIWPESAIAAGAIRNPLIIFAAKVAARVFYRAADRIVVISRRMDELLRERLGRAGDKVRVIPLGTDLALFDAAEPDVAWRRACDLEGKFVAVYAGAHSRLNGLAWLLRAAAHLKDDPDIRIVLIGDGVMKPDLMEQARAEGLGNVLFLDPIPKERLVGVLKACDLGLMLLQNLPIIETACPNKFMDYLAAALPVLVNFNGEAGWICREEGCGVVVPPDDPAALAAAIRGLARDPARRSEMARRARAVAEARFDRARLVEDFERVLGEVVRHEPA
jgi:glycosyltransferase involved in cell wall biosynthesis